MYKNFFKIALRYLWRNKTYSILNFACLTFGLTCAMIAFLHIMNTLSYDKFHKNYNRLYSVDAYVTYFNGDRFPKDYLSASLADELKTQAPEMEQITRITSRDFEFVSADKSFTEKGYYADENFFDVFSFPLIQKKTLILNDPNSIVISELMALKFFENTDCIGKTLALKEGEKQQVFKVSGVFRRVPKQSLLQFDFILPFSKFQADNSWAMSTSASSNQTWVLLKEGANWRKVEAKIKNLIKNQEANLNQELFMFPLKDKILYSYASGKRVWREMQRVVIVGSIGFAILLIACFNFINLAIALNIRRYREAGIKKVSGSGKSMIVLQFLGETFIIVLLSLFCAILLVGLLLPLFNMVFHNDMYLNLLEPRMILFLTSVVVFAGLVSGLLPALYLSSSNPISVLKGKLVVSHSYSKLRQSLIVFQFSIPIVLIICMMVIRTQDSYLRNYDIGVDQDKLIVLDNSANIQSHAESVKAELRSIPEVEAASFTNCIPSRGAKVSNEVSWEGKDASEKLHFWCVNSDFDYNKVVKLDFVEGRFFNPAFSSDSSSYVINDVAARVMKNKNPLGSILSVEGKKGTVIGVVKGFHAIDLAGPLVPVIIRIQPNNCPVLLIKYSAGSFASINGKIKSVYAHYEHTIPYRSIVRDLPSFSNLSLPSNLVGLAFIIALLLASMGLFGLASFTAESRTKEIGIRKSNGATTTSVMHLLLKNYTKWLTIAYFVALPVAFLLGKFFLGRYHFHANMPYVAFLVGPFIAYFVALLTVSWQSWKVASRNPVEALRYE